MRHQIPQVARVVISLLLIFAIYMFGALIKELYDNYQIEQYIAEFEERNNDLRQENSSLQADLEYYTSERYKDKAYKQNLGRVNPGEQVIIIKKNELANNQLSLEEQQVSKRLEYYRELPNQQKWWLVLTQPHR